MDFGIAGKTARLMSSTRGLGFGCVAALIAEKVCVAINGRNEERDIDAILLDAALELVLLPLYSAPDYIKAG